MEQLNPILVKYVLNLLKLKTFIVKDNFLYKSVKAFAKNKDKKFISTYDIYIKIDIVYFDILNKYHFVSAQFLKVIIFLKKIFYSNRNNQVYSIY